MTLNQIAFIVLSCLALFGAVGVVFFNTPVRSAMALVVNFFTLGLVYFMLGSELIGITQIMVYAGAIMVLFLFVIMILKSTNDTDKPQLGERRFLFSLLGAGIVFGMIYRYVIMPTMGRTDIQFTRTYGTPQEIGKTLFTQYAWPFEIVSMLLLVGIVGSIMLAKRKF
ncbi:MAG: NADH-quinone oxidoreductase subunit J [Fimbriimonadaceae bacterium]|nr:NADH-quinone oxidoreductase subunit J [Fimbriimonadaceae bacterium]